MQNYKKIGNIPRFTHKNFLSSVFFNRTNAGFPTILCYFEGRFTVLCAQIYFKLSLDLLQNVPQYLINLPSIHDKIVIAPR